MDPISNDEKCYWMKNAFLKLPFAELVVSMDDFKKLQTERDALQVKLTDANNRNMTLVSFRFYVSIVTTIFRNSSLKDGGRLYSNNIFINQVQCDVLDSSSDPRAYLNCLRVISRKLEPNLKEVFADIIG